MSRQLVIIVLIVLAWPLSSAQAAGVQTIATPSGFTVWLSEDHSLPLISVDIIFTKSGFAYDPENKNGRANLTAGLLMEGAGTRNAEAFNDALERHAIRMNIGLDEDTVGASLQTLSEHQDMAFALLADALIRPRFDNDAIERAKAKALSTLKAQSESPYYKLERSWQQQIYGNHPYGRPAIGSEKGIEFVTAADLQDYHRRYFTRENIIISIAGDIDVTQATRLIDTHFAAMNKSYDPDVTLSAIAFPDAAKRHVTPHDMPQMMVRFGMNGLARNDPDYLIAYTLNHIIGGGGLGSLLSAEIREKRGLVYSVYTQVTPYDYAASWGGIFATNHTQAKEAIQALQETLSAVKEKGITESQLADAKAFLTGSFVLNLDSNMEIARFMTIMQRFDLGADYMDRRNALVNAITPSDINRVAARLITLDNMCITAVGKGAL